MELYIITIFLKKDILTETINSLKSKNIAVKTFDETDQTGETAQANTFKYNGINFLLGECNSFHTHGDFEIGITTKTQAEFIEFRNKLADDKFQKIDQDDGTLLAIPSSGHNPFFFIFDRNIKCSTKELKLLDAVVFEKDIDFIQQEIFPHFNKSFRDKIKLSGGNESIIKEIVFLEPIDKFLDSEKKICSWPLKEADKQVVAEYLASKFEKDRIYKEKEINQIILENHTFMNTTMLRRELIERKLLERKNDCTAYWKV